MNEVSVLIKETPGSRFQRALLLHLPYEDTARRQLSMNQEADSHQTPNLLVP